MCVQYPVYAGVGAVKVMTESRKTQRSVITLQPAAALRFRELFFNCPEKQTASVSNCDYLAPALLKLGSSQRVGARPALLLKMCF